MRASTSSTRRDGLSTPRRYRVARLAKSRLSRVASGTGGRLPSDASFMAKPAPPFGLAVGLASDLVYITASEVPEQNAAPFRYAPATECGRRQPLPGHGRSGLAARQST